jgi:hypothetical protein
MELFESHFAHIDGNLYYDENAQSYNMFSNFGTPKHINYISFKELFKQMEGLKDPIILETGIASAGTHSTLLFNEYVRKYGGQFISVDINNDLVQRWSGNMCPASTLVHDDSVNFLKRWVRENPNKQANVVYLDSYDLDWYNYHPSANHGLEEFEAIKPALKENSLLLIDDTPLNPYWTDNRDKTYFDMCEFYKTHEYMPGKGMYIVKNISKEKKLLHTYQVLYKF